jgi:hypothetical protein
MKSGYHHIFCVWRTAAAITQKSIDFSAGCEEAAVGGLCCRVVLTFGADEEREKKAFPLLSTPPAYDEPLMFFQRIFLYAHKELSSA